MFKKNNNIYANHVWVTPLSLHHSKEVAFCLNDCDSMSQRQNKDRKTHVEKAVQLPEHYYG